MTLTRRWAICASLFKKLGALVLTQGWFPKDILPSLSVNCLKTDVAIKRHGRVTLDPTLTVASRHHLHRRRSMPVAHSLKQTYRLLKGKPLNFPCSLDLIYSVRPILAASVAVAVKITQLFTLQGYFHRLRLGRIIQRQSYYLIGLFSLFLSRSINRLRMGSAPHAHQTGG